MPSDLKCALILREIDENPFVKRETAGLNLPALDSLLEKTELMNHCSPVSPTPDDYEAEGADCFELDNNVNCVGGSKVLPPPPSIFDDENASLGLSDENNESVSTPTSFGANGFGFRKAALVPPPSLAEPLLLRHLRGDFEDYAQNDASSSPETHGESPNGVLSPTSSLSSPNTYSVPQDANTQATLIHHTAGLRLDPDTVPCVSGMESDEFWSNITDEDPASEPRKAKKSCRDADAPSSVITSPSVSTFEFDAGGAMSTSEFIFGRFTSDVAGVFAFGKQDSGTHPTDVTSSRPVSSTTEACKIKAEPLAENHIKGGIGRGIRKPLHAEKQTLNNNKKDSGPEPSLFQHFPPKCGKYELRITIQPEEHHRARYMTEGSRGTLKDRSQQGHPCVKLLGYEEVVKLQVYIGTDTGKVKPHGFYQACKVCGKTSTACVEKDLEKTKVIEMDMLPDNQMESSIDNVGILKLRNADVEHRIGVNKLKKKSIRARVVFRVTFPRPEDASSYITLQTISDPILCTQPIGSPEICRKSLSECSVTGGGELFVIGKNFLRGTRILFQELDDDGQLTWEKEGEIDKDYFANSHMICTVPAFHDSELSHHFVVQLVAECGGKSSDPHSFTYTPGMS